MDKKKECKIVQDLLPNYIEKLTSNETNEFVESHLKDCSDCKNMLNAMKKDINIDTPKDEKKEIEYMEKYNKKMKKLAITLIIILLAIIIVGGILAFHAIRYYIVLNNFDKYIRQEFTSSDSFYYSDKLIEEDENSVEFYYSSDELEESDLNFNSSSDLLLYLVTNTEYCKARDVVNYVNFGIFENQFCYVLTSATGKIYLNMDYEPIGFINRNGDVYTCEIRID